MVADVVDASWGSESSWASAELLGAEFGDRRLNARAEQLLEQWGAKPSLSIPAACGGWAEDEYETIDRKLGEGVFNEDLLATVRESIQTHRRLIWAFAGSHHIQELTHAPWASYLVSVRTVEVPAFTQAETRLLLTEPLKHSPLWAENDAQRPRFDPVFWGEDGIERIHAEAGGWPHLVQLLAETTVDMLNDSEQPAVSPELLAQAFDQAVVNGQVVLQQLMKDESTLPGEWDDLRRFRRADTQPPPQDEAVYESLIRRELVVEDGGQWRLRVPLMQRWLRTGR